MCVVICSVNLSIIVQAINVDISSSVRLAGLTHGSTLVSLARPLISRPHTVQWNFIETTFNILALDMIQVRDGRNYFLNFAKLTQFLARVQPLFQTASKHLDSLEYIKSMTDAYIHIKLCL